MKITPKCFIFVLVTVVGVIALLAGNANAEISGLESYPLVCQKGLVTLDHDINYFDKEFGAPVSKKKHKLTDIGFEGIIMTEIIYRNAVTMNYLTGNGKDMVYEVTLGSSVAQKKARFDVQTKNGIKKLYGVPYKETSSSLIYQCEGQVITFTTKNGQISAVKIHTESSAM